MIFADGKRDEKISIAFYGRRLHVGQQVEGRHRAAEKISGQVHNSVLTFNSHLI